MIQEASIEFYLMMKHHENKSHILNFTKNTASIIWYNRLHHFYPNQNVRHVICFKCTICTFAAAGPFMNMNIWMHMPCMNIHDYIMYEYTWLYHIWIHMIILCMNIYDCTMLAGDLLKREINTNQSTKDRLLQISTKYFNDWYYWLKLLHSIKTKLKLNWIISN